MQLPDAFDIFYGRISLGQKPTDRIQSAAGGLIAYLSGAYSVPTASVFLQGSYPNGTAVEPEGGDGEYDVDLVCASIGPGVSSDQALIDVEAKIAEHGTYSKLLRGEGSRKRPCVRLFYSQDEIGAFHVDVVPARNSQTTDPQAPLEVPRRNDAWHDTAPSEYTQWCRERGERFARTVKMLKRWRDVHQSARKSIKSIVLQVLAANNLGRQASDAEALVATLETVHSVLAVSPERPPRIENPVLKSENLGARWEASSYRDFLEQLDVAQALARRALDAPDAKTSHELWRELLGDDFPEYEPEPEGARTRTQPTTPAPGFHRTQAPPRRDEYGS
jgi:Second Messenger Oligonucleotide or Dinucleotide Synthetase domain